MLLLLLWQAKCAHAASKAAQQGISVTHMACHSLAACGRMGQGSCGNGAGSRWRGRGSRACLRGAAGQCAGCQVLVQCPGPSGQVYVPVRKMHLLPRPAAWVPAHWLQHGGMRAEGCGCVVVPAAARLAAPWPVAGRCAATGRCTSSGGSSSRGLAVGGGCMLGSPGGMCSTLSCIGGGAFWGWLPYCMILGRSARG